MNAATDNLDTAAAAKLLRAELLRRHGWTGRDVSVRTDRFSMGSAIRITINRLNIPAAAVKAVAEPFERVRCCEVTGEILSGGNRYVSVTYAHEALDRAAAVVAGALTGLDRLRVRGSDVVIERTGESRWTVRDAVRSESGCFSRGVAAHIAMSYATNPVAA